MAFVVLRVRNGWRVRHDRYEGPKRLSRRIPVKEYSQVGFSEHMTLLEARERAKQLTATTALKRQEEKRQGIKDRIRAQETRLAALIPHEGGFALLLDTNRQQMQWRAAKELIIALPVSYAHWSEAKSRIYSYFLEKKWGVDYSRRLIKLMNRYGRYVARLQGTMYEDIPPLYGHYKERLVDASRKQKSLPLSPEELEKAKGTLAVEHYRWIFLTIWFGLRPEEADGTPSVVEQQGHTWLRVYQSKLTSLPKAKRLKFIPILFPEQWEGIKLLAERRERPSRARMKKVKAGAGLYAGRHGFIQLMKSRGRGPNEAHKWMGHTNINRTLEVYWDKEVGYIEGD